MDAREDVRAVPDQRWSDVMTAASTADRRRLDGWTNPLRDPRDKRLPRIAGPSSLVIFGVTGAPPRKRLVPAITALATGGLRPRGFPLGGFGRRNGTPAASGQIVHAAARAPARTPWRQEVWDRLAE